MAERTAAGPASGRTALISGATRGLGLETACRLGARGVFVHLGARSAAAGQDAVEAVVAAGGQARAVVLDVTDPASVRAAVRAVEDEGRGLDILVNNAGRIVEAPATASTTASLSMTASGHDFGGNAPARMAYSSSKAALNMVTLQLAAALRADPALSHVAVDAVTPGFVATDINDHQGTRTVVEGTRIVVGTALAGPEVPSGAFLDDQGPVPW